MVPCHLSEFERRYPSTCKSEILENEVPERGKFCTYTVSIYRLKSVRREECRFFFIGLIPSNLNSSLTSYPLPVTFLVTVLLL